MCVLAAVYWPNFGWVGVKNRDRNYRPTVDFRKSHLDDIERLYIWDEKTRYTEGLNQYGVAIISASLMTKDDEKEHSKGETEADYYSPDGKKIRTALLEPTVKDAVKSCINSKLSGHTFIFDAENLYLLEGAKLAGDGYAHKVVKANHSQRPVRTNHGIILPKAGYQKEEDEEQTQSRESSESRLKLAKEKVSEATSPMSLINGLTYHKKEDPQMNPMRLDPAPTHLKTTGQLMLIPRRQTLYYRPILCDISFDYAKLNQPQSHTFFELLSMRPLLKDEKIKI
jgi:hypothetical protein